MTNPDWAPEERFQKFIIVYVDGRCRPTKSGVPVDPSGDGCERGTWYTDAPLGGQAMMETHMLELVSSERQREFGLAKRDTLPRYCRECDVRFACQVVPARERRFREIVVMHQGAVLEHRRGGRAA